MSDNTVILEVNDLHKSYGDHEVLKGISTTIKKGDVLALIGPSGCGKSTFLRSLNLLEVPTSGHVLFEGTDMTDASVDINHVREKIGMVFQQFNLFPNMTIRENIMLAPVKLGKMTKEEAAKKAEDLLARIGLADKADAYPAQLSGGQKQRRQHCPTFCPEIDNPRNSCHEQQQPQCADAINLLLYFIQFASGFILNTLVDRFYIFNAFHFVSML